MKSAKHLIIGVIILLSCLFTFTFADDIAKVVQAMESNAKIIYNGKEIVLEAKPFSIEGYNYLSVRSLAALFDKNIDWNQAERKVIISDKPDIKLESLRSELAAKDKSITELQDKVKKLEIGVDNSKKLSIRDLQDEINGFLGDYDDVYYKVILSGNEDEIIVRIEVDLSMYKSAWSHLSVDDKENLVDEVYNYIISEYDLAKIKGSIIDIAESKVIMPFQYNWQGEIDRSSYRNYSTISSLEDKINVDYSDYFNGIHFTITLKGNDSNVEFNAYMQGSRFNKEWEDLSDTSRKQFMKKLCDEIISEFEGCNITGYIYDTDSESVLASCDQLPDGAFTFVSEE